MSATFDNAGRIKYSPNTTIDIGSSGDAVMIVGGSLYFKNEDDGLYYKQKCNTVEGVTTFAPDDAGVTL